MDEKKQIREQMLVQRDKLSIAERRQHDMQLCRRIEHLLDARNVRTVHTYLPMGTEPDIAPLIAKMLAAGITVVTPRALKKRQMENLVLRSLGDLEEGIYGTMHPAGGHVYAGSYDLFIIPGLAFDRRHYRLGYGAGYYDTFLAAQPGGYKLGVCYPFQFLDRVPVEPHDVPLDEVYW